MRASRRFVGAALALVLLGGATGCSDDDAGTDAGGGGDTTTTTAADGGGEVAEAAVTTVDFGFEDLPELTAGVTELTIQNDGEVAHEFAVVQLDDSATIDDFVAEMPAVLEGGPFPEAVGTGVGSPEVAPGESVTFSFTLPEGGRYAAFCLLAGDPELGEDEDGEAHLSRGMVAELEVGDGPADAAIDGTDGTITAIDYGFEPEVEAGDTNLTFTNDGPEQYHFVAVSVFPEGTTAEEAEAAFQVLIELPEGEEPPADAIFPEDVAGSSVLGPGVSSTFEVPGGFESGRTYLLACFISDRAGGPPHAIANGMVHAFTVD